MCLVVAGTPGVILHSKTMSTHPISILPNFIVGFISTASQEQKQCLLNLLTEEINQDPSTDILPQTGISEPSVSEQNSVNESDSPSDCNTLLDNEHIPPSHNLLSFVPPIFSNLVEHIPELEISDELSSGLLNELNSLKLRSRGYKGKPAKVKTQWLSPTSSPYNYGKVINQPKPICDFPNVTKLMELVNSHPSTSGDMSACLVSCMSTAKSSLNYHTDDEDLICQDSDICTFSIGPQRSLEFIKLSQSKGRKGILPPPEFSVPAGNHSLNIMRAGCQQKLMHRVPPGNDSGVRYSLSFRRIVPPPSIDFSSATVSDSQPEATASVPSSPATQKEKHAKKVTLLAGDSYFARLDKNKLGKGKEDVFNVAIGGRKIAQVEQDIKSFIDSHPDLEVKTLFLSIGTNDIRNCKQGINHLKPVLANFMKNIKLLVPRARIFLQSLLPIPANGNPKAEFNVISMNNLIYNLCSRYKLFYIDVFNSFLNSSGNRNLKLFPVYDSIKNLWDIHPNKKGMGVLAKHYIYLIHSKWFNPMGY